MKTTRTIFAGIGTLALIGGLAACGTAKAPVAKPAVTVTQTVTAKPAPATHSAKPKPVPAPATAPATQAAPAAASAAAATPAATASSGRVNCTGGTDEADSYYAGAGSSCAFAKAVLQAWVNAGGESAPAGQAVGVDVSGINEICNEEGAGTVICTADSGYYEVMS
jgi:2-oxoglutarate dehydrogenase E2 component (dihydrolipoamide succinyltransferase)